MTQTWQPPAVPAWPAPTPVAPPARLPVFRGFSGKNLLLAGGVVVAGIVGLAALGSSIDAPAKADDRFYVSAGWSTSRLVDLSLEMQRVDGISREQAHCAMKNLAGAITWLEWQAVRTGADQLSVIQTAEVGCPG